jgi:hypothetical protein
MKYKRGVDARFLKPQLTRYLPNIDAIFRYHAPMKYPWHATITSANDGHHMDGSKHDTYEAIDLRIWYLGVEQVDRITCDLRALLGPDYDVILEDSHIHVEYDPQA